MPKKAISRARFRGAITRLTRSLARPPNRREIAADLGITTGRAGSLAIKYNVTSLLSRCPRRDSSPVTRYERRRANCPPIPSDEWLGDFDTVTPDNDLTGTADWLWSRSVPNIRVEHEIRDPDAMAVLDAYDWQTMPRHQPDGHRELVQALRDYRESIKREPRGPVVGVDHHNAVLCPDKVVDIRARAASGQFFTAIAAQFGITDTTVRKVVFRATWRHVP